MVFGIDSDIIWVNLKIHVESIFMPLATLTSTAVARLVALATIRATAMGLLPAEDASFDADRESVGQLLEHVQRAGIGRGLVLPPSDVHDPAAHAALLEDLLEAMAASPAPESEWPTVERVLGTESLAALLGISVSSLRRYVSGARATPDEVAARLHFLALVIGYLAGSYNEYGVRRWFSRKRAALGDRAPSELLAGDWDADDEGPVRIAALAAALLDSPST
jgi:hypothetical protein